MPSHDVVILVPTTTAHTRAGVVSTSDESAAELSTRMARGDPAAVERFYRAYFDFLLAEARRCTRRDEAFCLDVVQDATLRVVRCIGPVTDEAHLRRWLRVVVRSCAYDRLRADRRRLAREHAVGRERPEACAAQRQVDDDYDERLTWLRQELATLDARLVQMIDLRYRDGLRLRQIAAKLGLTIASVDGRIRRALEQLRLRGSES